jgi:tetratricopeptide (TPR) repeat protein
MTSQTWRRWGLWSTACLSWLIGLLSKEIAATLPMVILLFEWYFFQDLRRDWLWRNSRYLLVAVLGLIAVAVFYFDGNPLEKILSGYDAAAFTLWERVLTQFRVVVFYISLLFFPTPSRLNLIHEFTISKSWIEPVTTLLSFGVILALLGISLYAAKRWRILSFGILWFFVHLAIESTIIPLEIIYEHRLYLPLFGVVMLVSDLIFRAYSGRPKALLIATCCAIVMSLAAVTYLRNPVWRNPVLLWSDVVTKNPRSLVAHNNLGFALKQQGKLQEALREFQVASELQAEWLPEQNRVRLLNNLGSTLATLGDHAAAVTHLQQAVRIKPAYAATRHNLGSSLLELGRVEEAIVQLQEALQLEPNSPKTLNNLGNAYAKLGRMEEALHYLSLAVEQAPDADTHFNLANALARSGKLVEAETGYRKALKHDPFDADVQLRLANVLIRQRRLEAAIEQLSELLREYPELAEAHLLTGAIHMAQGERTLACEHFDKVLRLEPNHEQKGRLTRSCQEALPVPRGR